MNPQTQAQRVSGVEVQYASRSAGLPLEDDIHLWIRSCLPEDKLSHELCVRIVDAEESRELNNSYRDKNKPTNVLSFSCELPDTLNLPILGDLVICADVVQTEAEAQNKILVAHWAHMVVHGTLHLLGYDHIKESDATEMETLETQILTALGYPAPYETTD